MNRVRIFRSGELECRSVVVNSGSRPPPPAHGRRYSRGVSRAGARRIRRAVDGYVRENSCQAYMVTLTAQDPVDDREFQRRLASFLAWGRKYVPEWFQAFVWTKDLQQRGVLHAHLLFLTSSRIPKPLFRRMRNLWAERYEMGPGSFDVKKIHRPTRAAAYVAKAAAYLSREASRDHQGRRIGRNGEPYEREKFAGNAYDMSDALRAAAAPVTELWIEWGHGSLLGAQNHRGVVRFFGSVPAAETWLSSALDPPVAATSRQHQA